MTKRQKVFKKQKLSLVHRVFFIQMFCFFHKVLYIVL